MLLRDRNCKSSYELVPDHFRVIVIYDRVGSSANYCVVELSFRDTGNVHPVSTSNSAAVDITYTYVRV